MTMFPIAMRIIYGIMVHSLISGSRIPSRLFVNRAAMASLSGPAVNKPINLPIRIAKLKDPIFDEWKLYGGAPRACD